MQKRYLIYLLAATSFLIIMGLLMIYSSSSVWSLYKYNDAFHYLKNEALFVLIGLILFFISNKVKSDFFYKKTNLIFFVCIILLILVLIPGIGVLRNGSRSWFGFASFGIQPSELCKIGIILFISKYLASKKVEKGIKTIIIPLLYLLLVCFLIMLQPDFGTALIILITVVAILFISNLNKKFFYLGFLLLVFASIVLIIIAPYRMSRIISFINPWKDPLGTGFQIIQSLYAIGPGGLLGFGLFNSRQKYFYLPEPQTDFIFSILTEELGILGSIAVVFAFFIIIYVTVKISLSQTDLFKKYAIFGLGFGIVFQAVLNLAVVVGLIPVTGKAKNWGTKYNALISFK